VGVTRIVPSHAGWISNRGPKQRAELVGFRKKWNRVSLRLGHLGCPVETQNPLPLGHQQLRLRKKLPESSVKATGNLAGQFKVLLLILSYRYTLSQVEQNVGCLEDGIRQQPRVYTRQILRLVLELCHPLQFTQGCDGSEKPLQLGVLGNRRLDKQRTTLRVEAARHQAYRKVEYTLP